MVILSSAFQQTLSLSPPLSLPHQDSIEKLEYAKKEFLFLVFFFFFFLKFISRRLSAGGDFQRDRIDLIIFGTLIGADGVDFIETTL